jgi:hypothetical protein
MKTAEGKRSNNGCGARPLGRSVAEGTARLPEETRAQAMGSGKLSVLFHDATAWEPRLTKGAAPLRDGCRVMAISQETAPAGAPAPRECHNIFVEKIQWAVLRMRAAVGCLGAAGT